MTIYVRAVTTPSVDTSSPYTVNKPSGVGQGDFLLAVPVSSSPAPDQVSAPSGWYAVRGAGVNGTDNICAWYKVAGASEPSSYDFISSSSAITGIGILALYSDSGVINIDTVAVQVNASGNRTFPSVTLSAAGMAVCIGAAGSSVTSTPPGGMDERWDTTISGNRAYCMTGTFSAGATGTITATGTTSSSKCITIGLIEAATTYPGVRYRSRASIGPSSVTSSIALTMQSDIVAGDMLVAHLLLSADRTVTTPDGWDLQASLATSGSTRIYTRIADGTEAGATLTINFSTGIGIAVSLSVSAWWSPDGNTLQIGQVATSSNASASTHVFPTVTSTQDGSALIMLASKTSTTQWQVDNSRDMWERYDFGASSIRSGLFSEYLLAVGATGTRTIAPTSGSSTADMVSLLIEPVRSGILFDGVDMSDWLTSWKLESTVRVAPTTVLNNTAAKQIPIISDWLFTCTGLWEVAVDNLFGAACASSQEADSALFVEVRQRHLAGAVAYESDTAYVARYKAPVATIDGVLLFEATIAISGAPTRSDL